MYFYKIGENPYCILINFNGKKTIHIIRRKFSQIQNESMLYFMRYESFYNVFVKRVYVVYCDFRIRVI